MHCIFKKWCIISVFISTKCHSFHNFTLYVQIIRKFFINHALKYKYQSGCLKLKGCRIWHFGGLYPKVKVSFSSQKGEWLSQWGQFYLWARSNRLLGQRINIIATHLFLNFATRYHPAAIHEWITGQRTRRYLQVCSTC